MSRSAIDILTNCVVITMMKSKYSWWLTSVWSILSTGHLVDVLCDRLLSFRLNDRQTCRFLMIDSLIKYMNRFTLFKIKYFALHSLNKIIRWMSFLSLLEWELADTFRSPFYRCSHTEYIKHDFFPYIQVTKDKKTVFFRVGFSSLILRLSFCHG